ncbi:exonuclease SbcC [Levilactobacillus tujiorum]|uniref:Exonuclease SbcC n=1 Tax=Levilactobacillus tujiorum TaxID=2912243 RepID=A0ABX1L3F8_9LACO|nr:exonuclease SbcC [Levilactobacillus tujiorum]MCH5464583.1 exonuclease SbcC [Levilactobacillus tujiorum]NLR12842.1 exonuclease SbcC [Lactobacillus sp. HBUAS51387]NLR29563.1 exonuclease SbcC [Levilactobacillus tujiorum]NLR31280.1 exonuclease SbcC [Levilactobacillus tujiorum]
MENQEQQANAADALTQAIANKLDYLSTMQAAVQHGDDRKIYELLDQVRYYQEVKKTRTNRSVNHLAELVDNIHPQISHYLSDNLIDYLGHIYPFFYYEEYTTGMFHIYFGNWWDRRLFGDLDVINVRFEFDQTEYQKLRDSFALEGQNQRLNTSKIEAISAESEKLQELVDAQPKRDNQKTQLREQLKENSGKSSMPWESGKVKGERQEIIDQLTQLADEDEKALNAHKLIKENDDKILVLSKEDTILNYEKQSIRDAFDDFEHFEAHNASLYADYLNSLLGKSEGEVTVDD